MEKKFVEHLLNIGIIDKNSKYQIISIYNSIKERNEDKNQFNKNMTEILLSFFNTLSEVQKKFICFHLPVKFIKLCEQKIKNKLRNIIYINDLKKRIILLEYFFRWYKSKNKTLSGSNKNKINIEDDDFDSNKNIFRHQSYKSVKTNKFKKKINYGINNNICNVIKDFVNNANNSTISNNNKKNNITENKFIANNTNNNKNTKKDKALLNKRNLAYFNINLDQDDKENINYLNNGYKDVIKKDNKKKKVHLNNNYISEIIKNYSLNNNKMPNTDAIKENKQNKQFIDNNESNENYISTNINSIHRYETKKEKSNSKNVVNIKTYINNNNNSNLNIFNSPQTTKRSVSKKNSNIKIRNYNSNIYNLIYCNNYNNLNTNKYDEYNKNNNFNLFTEKTPFCEREIKTIETNRYSQYSPGQRLYEQGVKKLKNKKNLKNFSPIPTPRQNEKSKSVNYKHINSLYKNPKRCKTLEKVKNKVEKEEGLTFKPSLYKNNYIDRINSDFMERNYSSPKSGKNEYNYKEINNTNNHTKNKKLNKKEKENIVKGMINRLYKKKNFDDNEENSFLCKKYELKGVTGSYFLRGYKKKVE